MASSKRNITKAKAASGYERVSVKQAAAMLGMTKGAVEVAVQRDKFPNVKCDRDEKTGRTRKVWITKGDLEAYADERGIALPDAPLHSAPSRADSKPRVRFVGVSSENQIEILQGVLEELSSESLTLRVRVRELEAELARRKG